MKSISETSYGARIGNAEKLATALQTFINYQPQKPECSISELNTSIAAIKNQNTLVAANKQNYSLAVDLRLQIFEKNEFSIKKILSPINASVKISFGKEAKEATEVAGIIAKIRGANLKVKKTLEDTTVSQSYQSFGSKTQFFSDLIANLTNFGTNYSPVNNQLMTARLEELYADAVNANNQVMETYVQFIQNNNNRISSYENLSQQTERIKENIKAQYGFNSTEYKLVKGLSI